MPDMSFFLKTLLDSGEPASEYMMAAMLRSCNRLRGIRPPRKIRSSAEVANQSPSSHDAADADKRDQWIVDHAPMVRPIVRGICGNGDGHDVEDLVAAGMLGLVRAARRYREDRGADFRTYATLCIRSAVMDEFRKRSVVSRSVHRRLRQIRQAGERHTAAYGVAPDAQDLAADSGLSVEQVESLIHKTPQRVVSLQGAANDDRGDFSPAGPTNEPSPIEQAEQRELIQRLAEDVDRLSPRERLVLMLYYERELDLQQVAETLRTSKSRVCQIHQQVLAKLSGRLRRRRAA